MPPTPFCQSIPPNLSSPFLANLLDRASWSSARICTAQCSAFLKTSRLLDVLARLHRTMGGSRDTELKLLAVSPTGSPSAARVVTMVTPVVKVPRALRNSRVSNSPLADMVQLSSVSRLADGLGFEQGGYLVVAVAVLGEHAAGVVDVGLAHVCSPVTWKTRTP